MIEIRTQFDGETCAHTALTIDTEHNVTRCDLCGEEFAWEMRK